MNTTQANIKNFCKATYLNERISSPSQGDLDISSKVDEGWIKNSGLNLVAFQERLKNKGLSYNDFVYLLENKNSPNTISLKWKDSLEEILSTIDKTLLEKNVNYADIGIFVLPFTNHFVHNLNQYCETHKFININKANFINSTEKYLFHELRQVSDKVIVLEFHKLKEQLLKENPNLNLNEYKKVYLTDPKYIKSVLSLYPVLGRSLTEITERTINNVTTLLDRYKNDYKIIKETFFGNDIELESVSFGLGDSHKNGQSVSILTFKGGNKLVYKPRSLKIDNAYNQFLEWINNQGISIKLKNVISINYEEYGWQQFIFPQECISEQEVQAYYFRMGANIAIFHLLRTSDMHYENILASGSVPYVIDLETLFSNSVFTDSTLQYPRKELLSTVLSSGVLPTGHLFNSKLDFDPSALVGKPKQTSESMKGWVLVEDEKDGLKYENVNFVTSNESHLVKFNNIIVNPVDYIANIEQGFTEVYNILLKNKDNLFNLISSIFEEVECRIVLRPTFMYSRFLISSYHPNYLGNGLDREELLEMLWNITRSEEKFHSIVDSEINDLLNHDIPYFTYQVDSNHLYDSNGKLISNVFDQTSLGMVREQILLFSPENLLEQLNLIRLTIHSNEIANIDANEVEGIPAAHPVLLRESEFSFLKEAESIGDFLVEQVIYDRDYNYASWLGIENVNNKYQLQSLDFSLYNGMFGISIFLGQLYKHIPKTEYKEIILKNINYINERMNQVEGELINSVFNGIGSFAYGLYYLSSVLKEKHLEELGYEYLRMMLDLKKDNQNVKDSKGQIYTEANIDFISGHAGIITFAVNLYESKGIDLALEIAENYGLDLLDSLEKHFSPKLLGLAHGTSGIILALDKLDRVIKDERISIFIEKLVKYEDEHFELLSLNWLDLRENVSEQTSAYYWCHGAPGILLSRAELKQNHTKSSVKETKVIRNFITNHFDMNRIGICHGIFGNLDILLSLMKKYPKELPKDEILNLAESYIQNKDIRSILQGLKDRGLLGLMLGISGVGYSLLRLHNTNVPSVLCLEIPK